MIKREQIVEVLREQILSGELPRGARMRQDDLASRFDASITPVREALRLLEAEGLLVSEPHRGARVAGVDLDKLKAVYVVRRLTETYAMQRAVGRLSPRDLGHVRSILQRMRENSAGGDAAAYRRENKEFHFFFYQRCGIPALADQIDGLWQAFPWDLMLVSSARIRRSQREHLAILRAVEAGDLAATAAATEAHIAGSFLVIATQLSGGDGPLADPYDLATD